MEYVSLSILDGFALEIQFSFYDTLLNIEDLLSFASWLKVTSDDDVNRMCANP